MIRNLILDRALARQSYDALAAELAQSWRPKPPDKHRSARSLAAEIRKLAAGTGTWFLRRPEAAHILARILHSTPAKLGIVPFEIQTFDPNRRAWREHATSTTLAGAEDQAWALLTQYGGAWRVRQGTRTIARGSGHQASRGSRDRTAVWSRVREAGAP